jgi:hypothetical protein
MRTQAGTVPGAEDFQDFILSNSRWGGGRRGQGFMGFALRAANFYIVLKLPHQNPTILKSSPFLLSIYIGEIKYKFGEQVRGQFIRSGAALLAEMALCPV